MSATFGPIDDSRVIEDLAELVRIDSQNPGPGEAGCAAWVASSLEEAGICVMRQSVARGRENLLASVSATKPAGPRLVLLAHLDTVPIGTGWTVDPLGAEIRNGRLYGRGAADMKAGLAIALGLLRAAAAARGCRCDLVLAATVDEEGPNMLGAHALVDAGSLRRTDQLLALEPTGLRLRIAQVGLRWLSVTVYGRMAHAGRAHLGVDANHVMSRLVDRLKERVLDWNVEHPLLGRPRFTCGKIEGGVAPNVVPGTCTAEFDLRVVPPLEPSDAESLVTSVAEEVVAEFPGSRCEITPLGVARPPVQASADSRIVQGIEAAFRRVTGGPLARGGDDGHEAYTDSSMISALTGSTSATVFGPGSSDQAHVADEYVALEDLVVAARTLESLIAGWHEPANDTSSPPT